MNFLDAINICLTQGTGVRPISSETDPSGGATTFINIELTNILKGGYPLNLEEMDLLRQTDDTIKVPPDVLSVLLPSPYTVRSKKVWHRKNRTHTMTRDFLNVTVAIALDFEELDESAQDFIAWSAAAKFAASKRGAGSERAAFCRDQAEIKEVELSLEHPAELIQHENPQYAQTLHESITSNLWCNV